MYIPFREYHLLNILSAFEKPILPLDLFLRNYFRAHKAIGSKDRKEICNTIYTFIRHRSLLEHLGASSWQEKITLLRTGALNAAQCDASIPPHIRVSFPLSFYTFLSKTLGEEKAYQFCSVSNEQAPTTIRVNTLLTDRNALFDQWKQEYSVSLCIHSPAGIHFKEKINFLSMPAFKEGLFEVQDESSQRIAALVQARPKDLVLDYCAGSGGKALAIAPLLQNLGQLFLHDIRIRPLEEAKKRLRRAGVHNAQILANAKEKERLKEKMDWVLVDAPCSGTGTLRRNPDMKWRLSEEDITRFTQEQRSIFEEALSFVKPQGHIVYATCSVLPQENEQQAKFFEQQFHLTRIGSSLALFPQSGQGDGFYGIVFQKTRK